VTLIAGSKRRSLLMAGNNDEVYDKKSQRNAKDNRTAFNRIRSDKFVAYVTSLGNICARRFVLLKL